MRLVLNNRVSIDESEKMESVEIDKMSDLKESLKIYYLPLVLLLINLPLPVLNLFFRFAEYYELLGPFMWFLICFAWAWTFFHHKYRIIDGVKRKSGFAFPAIIFNITSLIFAFFGIIFLMLVVWNYFKFF
jgi:hypothetical protein